MEISRQYNRPRIFLIAKLVHLTLKGYDVKRVVNVFVPIKTRSNVSALSTFVLPIANAIVEANSVIWPCFFFSYKISFLESPLKTFCRDVFGIKVGREFCTFKMRGPQSPMVRALCFRNDNSVWLDEPQQL